MAKYQKGICAANLETTDHDNNEEDGGVESLQNFDTVGKGGAKEEDGLEIIHTIFPLGGRALSALHPQLMPQYFEEPLELFDEFGFRLANESADASQATDPTLEKPPLESSSHRMRWLALIESAHAQVEDELCWAKVDMKRLRHTPKFLPMVNDGGIPHSLRPFLWPRLCSATDKRKKTPCDYAKIVRKSGKECVPGINVQIEKDLLRTLPTHLCFSRSHSLGIAPLRRVLRAVAFLFPEIGYCQGMAFVVASLLLVCCEENTFWMMCSLIEDILPASFYSPSLLGVRADERVLRHLIQVHMPELTEQLGALNLDTTTVFINWLITLLASALSPHLLFRVWDHLFIFGSTTVFRAILALLKLADGTFVPSSNAANLLNQILRIPSTIGRPEHLLEMAQSFEYSVTDHLIAELRKKYQGIMMAEIGLISNKNNVRLVDAGGANGTEENLPKQTTMKRKLHRSKSVVRRIFDKKERRQNAEDDLRTKNIRQTELVLDLRNAILQICAHFAECPEAWHRGLPPLNTQADYSDGFDLHKEREQFLRARHEGQRRGRALINFDQRDDDDLGFKKNDLITIVSEKDEHCWMGELDGRRGWFPAKFVKRIDERGKDYCARGDEMVCARVAELVRGPLAFAFQQILCHGLRSSFKSSLWSSSASSSSSSHPWTFIDALARAIVPSATADVGMADGRGTGGGAVSGVGRCSSGSANSKLTLCHTFGLDQDGQRVLGPEELLHVAVRSIHRSHAAANAPADTKLRSLVAFGLNEQICCELKLLAQLAFNMDIDSELVSADELARSEDGMAKLCVDEARAGTTSGQTQMNGGGTTTTTTKNMLRDGVQDMLIKHHLFSWDL